MGASKQIVAVDDDPIIRSLIEQSLPRPEFEVHAFADGRDALMRLHEIRPDLIISDMLMPDMDGRTFFQVVKRSAQLREVPFIFLSGVQATDEIVATLEDGADDFVSKPFSGLKLQAKVRALLRLAGRGAAPVEERRHDQLAGSLGRDGTLPLVKFCEDIRLSGRLSIVAPGVERWAEFLGGELVRAGGTPEEPSEEPSIPRSSSSRLTHAPTPARSRPGATRTIWSSARARRPGPRGCRVDGWRRWGCAARTWRSRPRRRTGPTSRSRRS
jgi:CheY-like chemotaxis protein